MPGVQGFSTVSYAFACLRQNWPNCRKTFPAARSAPAGQRAALHSRHDAITSIIATNIIEIIFLSISHAKIILFSVNCKKTDQFRLPCIRNWSVHICSALCYTGIFTRPMLYVLKTFTQYLLNFLLSNTLFTIFFILLSFLYFNLSTFCFFLSFTLSLSFYNLPLPFYLIPYAVIRALMPEDSFCSRR